MEWEVNWMKHNLLVEFARFDNNVVSRTGDGNCGVGVATAAPSSSILYALERGRLY